MRGHAINRTACVFRPAMYAPFETWSSSHVFASQSWVAWQFSAQELGRTCSCPPPWPNESMERVLDVRKSEATFRVPASNLTVIPGGMGNASNPEQGFPVSRGFIAFETSHVR